MRSLPLSIRTTVLLAIVIGVVLPALVVVSVEGVLARRTHEPLIERSRDAVMGLGAAVVAEPAWTLSEPGLRAAVGHLMADPSICAVALLDLQPGQGPSPYAERSCASGQRVSVREAPVLHDGRTIARLRVTFDDNEIERLVAARRLMTGWLVAAQVLLGIAVLAGVLSLRLLRPIDTLKRQAGRLAAREPLPRLHWPRRDELGQLGEHLYEAHVQIRSLIGELEQKNRQLHQMAMYDHLTGLPNRTLLRELFTREAAIARREGAMLALLFIDLDQFKAINDTHGHAAGDELLIKVGDSVQSTLRESDVVCRMGGDEFLVLLPHVDGWDVVAATADRLLQAIETPHALGGAGEPQRVRASIGIAMYPADGADFDALARAADLAMYRSKELGRGRYSFYHADLDASFRHRLELERELADAIEQRQLVLHYQAVVDASDGRVTGCEALVRWMHPRHGLLAPGAFIHVAEEAGLVPALGRWVLDAACAQLRAWKAAGAPPLQMAVNVSALQLRQADFPDTVRHILQRHGIEPGELSLELTESTLLADGDGALATVQRLREAGARLALDDFGTGYSSLSYLKRLRPDLLKIDRSFVRDLPDDADDCLLTQAILGMAHALSIEVLAEGVENEAQRDWLLAQGARLQQGFLWARPVPAGEFEQRLAPASA